MSDETVYEKTQRLSKELMRPEKFKGEHKIIRKAIDKAKRKAKKLSKENFGRHNESK